MCNYNLLLQICSIVTKRQDMTEVYNSLKRKIQNFLKMKNALSRHKTFSCLDLVEIFWTKTS